MIFEKKAAAAFCLLIFICLPGFEVAAEQRKIADIGPAEDAKFRSQLHMMGYYEVDATIYFPKFTDHAVAHFQRDFNLPATGVIGQPTRDAMGIVEMMARIVHGEARGERYIGQVGVAAVILNRVASEGFPDTVEEVIFQPNAFTAVNDGQYLLEPDSDAYRAVKDALKGMDPANGAVYYFNPDGVTDNWIYSRTVITQIGRHFFAQ